MFVLVSSLGLFFLFGFVRQTKLATRQLLGARSYSPSYRIVAAKRLKGSRWYWCDGCHREEVLCIRWGPDLLTETETCSRSELQWHIAACVETPNRPGTSINSVLKNVNDIEL